MGAYKLIMVFVVGKIIAVIPIFTRLVCAPVMFHRYVHIDIGRKRSPFDFRQLVPGKITGIRDTGIRIAPCRLFYFIKHPR
jgi:hypothetical protein